ncbi:hypothetical protein E5082_10605 [Streptomyces griseoluteus]|uniref:Uncharacterized protein n=1 Tax=Streptomyces griseoluteus TaxID=29306 RepID=A0A4Z1DKU2_STRGP|nr:hypothetical protein [Streptomyces griseoluteus]TGN84791.1 hypothetical protein E5082_10605 [Streptomyces griseoluteus]GHF01484.1 hypothetical protein GCM10017776_18500 [Streptomyces griseoluteus]
MSVNDEYPQQSSTRTAAIPRTIAAITDALPPARRDEFHADVHHAQQGAELDAALMTWWLEAMFETVPGRDQRLDDTVAGVGLVELEPETEER